MERDHGDVHRADILLVNLTGAHPDHLSIGTMMELAWAWHAHIPRVSIIEPYPNSAYDRHPMAREAIGGFRYATLPGALDAVYTILGLPGVGR